MDLEIYNLAKTDRSPSQLTFKTICYCSSAMDIYGSCDIIAIPGKYDIQPYAFGFQKNSPYLSIFNHYIKELREKGSLQQILSGIG